MITGVALRWGLLLFRLPKPNRHHHLFAELRKLIPEERMMDFSHRFEQGFVDEHDVYYSRESARRHAVLCGQLGEDSKLIGSILTSEDLW